MTEEKILDAARQAELVKKYGKLSAEEIAKMEADNDEVLFTKVLNDIFRAACDFEVIEEDAEDVAGMLSIYAHMLSFDPIEYIALLKASG